MPSKEDLKALQSESLERKILITQTRIIEWYLHYKGQVYVSFSGGKDSTVLLHIARQCFPDIEAVFADTGLEYPEIRGFVKSFENVTIVKPKMQFKEVIERYGYPVISKEVADTIHGARVSIKHNRDTYRVKKIQGRLFDKDGKKSIYNIEKWGTLMDAPFKIAGDCCHIMKKTPLINFSKTLNKKAIIGTMTGESRLRESKWLKFGCNSFDQVDAQSTPLSFWTEQDVLHYIKNYNLPYCSVYGELVNKSDFIGQLSMDDVPTDLMMTGCQRTGCMFCMFGVHLEKEPNRFQKMKLTHPKQYDYCIRESYSGFKKKTEIVNGELIITDTDEIIEYKGLGLGKVLDFIGVKY